jgi:hypothetical protein
MADEAKTAGERLASLAIPTAGNVTKNIDNNLKVFKANLWMKQDSNGRFTLMEMR